MTAFVLGFMLAGLGWSIYAATTGRATRRAIAKRRHPATITSYPRIDRGEWI